MSFGDICPASYILCGSVPVRSGFLKWLCCQVEKERELKEQEKEKEREHEKERELEAQKQQESSKDAVVGATGGTDKVCSIHPTYYSFTLVTCVQRQATAAVCTWSEP